MGRRDRNYKLTKQPTKKSNSKRDIKKGEKKKNKKINKIILALFMIFLIAIFIGIIIISAIFVASFKVSKDEFDINDLVIGESNSYILDAEGNVLANLNGDEKRKIISITEMAEYLPKAYVAIEDERFYEHNGVDFKRTGHAILNFVLRKGSTSFGGSTITQQLVKNATSDKEKTIDRKLKEWARAYKVEEGLSKDQILETYLNIIFVGQDYYGVELGAKYYFNKSAKDLTLSECAFMAGINNSPNAYKPFAEDPDGKNAEKIKKRTKTVLTKMHELGYIHTEEEYTTAMAEVENGLQFSKGETYGNVYSYHTDALLSQVIEDVMNQKGISKELATSYVYGGGLTIYSTQDANIQSVIEEEVKKDRYVLKSRKNEGEYAEAAVVVIDQESGYVLGCSGGLGEKTESRGLNRATQSPRQTGSSFKPIAVVAPALQEGIITAASEYEDAPTTFSGNYRPKNYNYYRGMISVRQAIETSQNIPFVKIMQQLGVEKSKVYLEKMGITTLTKNDAGLSMAIGGLSRGVTPLEMCGAYACIANDGKYIKPSFYSKVVDSKGNVVLEAKKEETKVLDEAVAYVTKNILLEPVEGSMGTAKYCGLSGIDVAAKTGTTNSDYDRWLCGFSPYYTCVAWYGYDENEEVKYNGTNPAGLLFSNVMAQIHDGLEPKLFEQPSGVVSSWICRDTGLCASETCSNCYQEKFVAGTVPGVCGGHIAEPEPEPEPEQPNVVVTEIKDKTEEEKKKEAEEKKKAEDAKKTTDNSKNNDTNSTETKNTSSNNEKTKTENKTEENKDEKTSQPADDNKTEQANSEPKNENTDNQNNDEKEEKTVEASNDNSQDNGASATSSSTEETTN